MDKPRLEIKLKDDWSDEGFFDYYKKPPKPRQDIIFNALEQELRTRRHRKDALAALLIIGVGGLLVWGHDSLGDHKTNTRQVQIETPSTLPEAPPAIPIVATPEEMDELFFPHSLLSPPDCSTQSAHGPVGPNNI